MRQIPITLNTELFQLELKRSGNGRVPPITPAEIARLPVTATVLVGDKTKDMGGGLSGTGYVMQSGKATHSVAVSADDVRRGALRL